VAEHASVPTGGTDGETGGSDGGVLGGVEALSK